MRKRDIRKFADKLDNVLCDMDDFYQRWKRRKGSMYGTEFFSFTMFFRYLNDLRWIVYGLDKIAGRMRPPPCDSRDLGRDEFKRKTRKAATSEIIEKLERGEVNDHQLAEIISVLQLYYRYDKTRAIIEED